jgi:hypothetical protein
MAEEKINKMSGSVAGPDFDDPHHDYVVPPSPVDAPEVPGKAPVPGLPSPTPPPFVPPKAGNENTGISKPVQS